MKYYLVIVTTDFFDPHGSPDEGGVVKFVTTNERYTQLNPNAYYIHWEVKALADKTDMSDEDFIETIKESEYDPDCLSAEDGYNLEVQSYIVKEITEEQYKHFDYIINEYNKI